MKLLWHRHHRLPNYRSLMQRIEKPNVLKPLSTLMSLISKPSSNAAVALVCVLLQYSPTEPRPFSEPLSERRFPAACSFNGEFHGPSQSVQFPAAITLFHSAAVGMRHPAPSSKAQGSLAATQSKFSLMFVIQGVLGVRMAPSCL